MNKLNFLSEGNSMVSFDLDNEKENYYSKKLSNIKRNTDDINYYYSEINIKNKQINELKSIILNMKNNQEKLFYEVKSLQEYIPNFSPENKNKTKTHKNTGKEEVLLSKIKKLQIENMKLKIRLNKNEEKENIFYNSINNKLLKAERDIQLLSFENKNNNNLILAIQNFLFNINDKINSDNQALIFDLSLIDNNTFIHNLQILESKIINKLNQLNNIGNMCLYTNSRNSTKRDLYDLDDNLYNLNHYTINDNIDNIGNKLKNLKNFKNILKNKNGMKTINYLNSQINKNKKKIKYGFLYNNYFDEKKPKNGKPLKAYSLKNNNFKEINGNDDINFEYKINKINSILDDSEKNDQ